MKKKWRFLAATVVMLFGHLYMPSAIGSESQGILWTIQTDNTTNPLNSQTLISSLATDDEGNIYFFGPFHGGAIFNETPIEAEKEGLPNVLGKLSADGRLIWSKRLGFGPWQPHLTAPNPKEVILTGFYSERADLGGATLQVGSMGSVIATKYDTHDGKIIWNSKTDVRDGSLLNVSAVVTTTKGSIVMAGNVVAPVVMGKNTISNSGVFLGSITSTGETDWTTSFLATGSRNVIGMACDSEGCSYLTGDFEKTILLGTNKLASSGSSDVFLAKFSPTGSCLWAKAFGGKSWDRVTGIDLDSSSNCYITGYFHGEAQFDTTTVVPKGGTNDQDIFLVKLDSNGKMQWAKTWGSDTLDQPHDLRVNRLSGNVVMTGRSTYIPALGLNNPSFGKRFLLTLTPEGNPVENKMFDCCVTDFPLIVVDKTGNIITTGSFNGAQTNSSTPSCFITKLTSSNNASGKQFKH